MLILQPLTEDDISRVIDAENHPDNRRFVGQWTPEQYKHALADPHYQCFIFVVDHQPVGHCLLYDLQNPDNAVLLKRIVVDQKGNGYGRAALVQIIKYAFDTLQVNRLWLDVRAYNTRAKSLYESAGFKHEGTQRSASLVDGQYYDLDLYGMLRDEYRY